MARVKKMKNGGVDRYVFHTEENESGSHDPKSIRVKVVNREPKEPGNPFEKMVDWESKTLLSCSMKKVGGIDPKDLISSEAPGRRVEVTKENHKGPVTFSFPFPWGPEVRPRQVYAISIVTCSTHTFYRNNLQALAFILTFTEKSNLSSLRSRKWECSIHEIPVRIKLEAIYYLLTKAHHKKVRVIGHDYLRSGQTVRSHFHEVLRSILKLHPLLLVKPLPGDENCSNNTWKWFKGCLCVLDGTYISFQLPNKDKEKYINRKGTTAINVLGICNCDMQFIYALTGWEGSAADAHVLRDAVNRQDGLKIPRGCYDLCDNGYPNVEGFLTPYRRTRYHMDQWVCGFFAPQNYKEFFNSKHCHARNVIERAFGL
ncbi:uncharacterized protein LOC142506695 [Primulina tabacum]|uniref:uncharacterized protein LOC142506695 n=1 Tax=Primulina tabacum TaxID=48773 RepID=UPI003F5A12FA